MALVPGARLGPYEILAALGAGGMGEVYRARDTRLGRSVAVKVVKASGTRDPALRERFEREARAISALDHPHICPLYDVGQDAGVEFLVMPCLEGETLASRLHTGALPLDRAVAIATQIADALDRAHRAGFVHRDLKPANIMLTKGSGARHGEVHATLLDFGLAKLTASPVALNPSLAATQPPQENLTGDATLVGTLQYMAPEQIEGKPVDARADLFALGAILHEMITGRPAFAAASPASVIAAILAHDPPRLSATATSVSPALDATVQRCLAKSPDDRFQSASDLRFALQTLGHEPPHGADVGPHRSRRNLPVRAVLTVAGAITLAGIGWMVTRPQSSGRASVPRLLNPLQVTNAVGVEDDAAWSPDGRMLAYAADPSGGLLEGNWDIWVVQPGGTPSLNRTPDSAADDRFPSWSPDGKLLAFWSNRDGGGCYVMPALAGSPRRIAEASLQDPNPPAWSADGGQLACVTLDGTDVYATIHTLRGGSSRRVALPGPPVSRRLFMAWSPDQRFMAYIETPPGLASDATQLWVLRLGDGKAFPVTEGRSRTWSPSWSPQSDAIYFVSNLEGAMDLWQQALAADGVPVGPPVRVTTGIGMRAASLSPDGSKVVYSQGRKISHVWRVPIPATGRGTWADAHQVTFDQAYVEFLSVAPDGNRLIVTSDRSGNPDLWQLSVDGGELQQIVADPAPDMGGTWSPDGGHIAFFSLRSGNRDLWRVAVNGGPAEQLTDHPGQDLLPNWSPDGQTIAFMSDRADRAGIWLLPTGGGQPQPVPTSAKMLGPQWSPDGRWLAVNSVAGELWRISPTGADPEVRLVDQVRAIRWSHDSRSIYFTGRGTRQNTVFAVPTDGGPERALVDLSGRRGMIGDIATDGPNLYFTWEENLGDLWIADVVPAPSHSR